jgi:putative transferase (TIGR04331 family)
MKILTLEGKNGLNFYPNETDSGVAISQEEMRIISAQYHDIYNPIIQNICKNIRSHTEVESDNLEVIIRYATIPIIHAFLDKLVRLNKVVKQNGTDFLVEELDYNYFSTPVSTVEFRRNVEKNYKFNSYVVLLISKLWGVKQVSTTSVYEPNEAPSKVKINNLSRIYPRNFFNGLGFRISLFLSKIRKGKIPVFGVAYAKAPLLKYGFYYKLFDDLELNWPIGESKVNDSLRSKVFTPDVFCCSELDEFYESQKIILNRESVNYAICNFVRHFFPIESLELFESNMMHAREVIKKYNSKFIVARGSAAKGKFIIMAAKDRGVKIIGMQHGGYFGYINDLHQTVEYEYRDLDIFISWGWNKLPNYNLLQNLKVVELPSPWLSERRKYWKSEKYINNKKFDVLFMPSGVKRFPLTLQGATGPRIDIINDVSLNIKDTFDALILNNISLLFKPYDDLTSKLLIKTLHKLSCKYGDKYNIVDRVDKGFTRELISSSGLILWNQPGTGFLECLTAGIPTMVLWTRFSTKEEEWAEEIFERLEKIGVVHSSTKTLVKEIKIFKKSPDEWMKNPKRTSVIDDFCNQYARIDDNWDKQWRDFFFSLT